MWKPPRQHFVFFEDWRNFDSRQKFWQVLKLGAALILRYLLTDLLLIKTSTTRPIFGQIVMSFLIIILLFLLSFWFSAVRRDQSSSIQYQSSLLLALQPRPTWCEHSSLRYEELGAKLWLACRGGPLSPTHPVEQASHVGEVPYWLGAAQLETGTRVSPTVE